MSEPRQADDDAPEQRWSTDLVFPRAGLFHDSARDLAKHRWIILNLVRRDLKIRYKGSVFGFLWALLNPLFTMLVFLFIFSLDPRIQGIDHYALFLLCGIVPFGFMSAALTRTVTILIDHTPLVKKIYFPREILPLSAVLADFVNLLLAMSILVVVLLLVVPGQLPLLWLLPLVLAGQLCFTLGLAMMLAAAQVFLRDTAQLLTNVLLFWYFLSPVFYPLANIPARIHVLYLLNPMASFICLYRAVLLHRVEFPVFTATVAVVAAVITLVVGFTFFKRTENSFVKLL